MNISNKRINFIIYIIYSNIHNIPVRKILLFDLGGVCYNRNE